MGAPPTGWRMSQGREPGTAGCASCPCTGGAQAPEASLQRASGRGLAPLPPRLLA